MNPYREAAERPVEVVHKPRGWLKTLQYKLLIWYRGPWKKRFVRCEYCTAYFERHHHIGAEPFWHNLQHYTYHIHKCKVDDDLLGPLR